MKLKGRVGVNIAMNAVGFCKNKKQNKTNPKNLYYQGFVLIQPDLPFS